MRSIIVTFHPDLEQRSGTVIEDGAGYVVIHFDGDPSDEDYRYELGHDLRWYEVNGEATISFEEVN